MKGWGKTGTGTGTRGVNQGRGQGKLVQYALQDKMGE